MPTIIQRLIPTIVSSGIGIVLLSPLPYGNVEIWSVSLFELVTFLTFSIWLSDKIVRGRIRLPRSPLYLPFGLFFLLIIIQTLTLPTFILNIVSPHTAVLWKSKSEALTYIFGNDFTLSNTISLYAFITNTKLLLYLSYGAFFIMTADYIRSRKQIKMFFWIVFAVALIESTIGLLQYIASGAIVPASGTYVNPNHFAGLLLLVLPLFLGYLTYLWTKKAERRSRWDKSIKFAVSTPLLILFSISFMAVSMILSQSRGAIFSFAASIVVFAALISRHKNRIPIKWLIGVFFIIIVLYSLWIGLDPVIEKFSAYEEDLPKRTYIWKDTIDIIKDFPIFGAGLGNFGLAYTLYKKEASWPLMYNHAHNDYLELAAETGLIGLILVLWAIIAFSRKAAENLGDYLPQKDPLRYYLFLGCLSGMFGMLIHAITEFNFQIPSNTYYFTFLLGLASSLLLRLNERKT